MRMQGLGKLPPIVCSATRILLHALIFAVEQTQLRRDFFPPREKGQFRPDFLLASLALALSLSKSISYSLKFFYFHPPPPSPVPPRQDLNLHTRALPGAGLASEVTGDSLALDSIPEIVGAPTSPTLPISDPSFRWPFALLRLSLFVGSALARFGTVFTAPRWPTRLASRRQPRAVVYSSLASSEEDLNQVFM
ncbi:hypothetical protein K438DRAFT_1775342 [Mycena galopus ATCC 62051]|nr:hypothetical protein K438DRAFT_1775342 [Mycena galopus ATCC 62051]